MVMLVIVLCGNAHAANPMTNPAQAQSKQFSVTLNIAESDTANQADISDIKTLINAHLTAIEKLNNPRMSNAEWLRLLSQSNDEIKELLATAGYFSPTVSQASLDVQHVIFNITLGEQAVVNEAKLTFNGAIDQQAPKTRPNVNQLNRLWPLKTNAPFTQTAWSEAKRDLLTQLITERYPQAKITFSQATVNPATHLVDIVLEVDSGPAFYFGETKIEGLEKYSPNLALNLNTIKPGDVYSQTALLNYQAELQATGKFSSVAVISDTTNKSDGKADILVRVIERETQTVAFGVGASTNTGARVQVSYDNRNLFGKGWAWETTTKLEQLSQSASSVITLPTTADGYRDSINNNIVRLDVEGQATTTINNGVKRTWIKKSGKKSTEQFVGANLLYEFLTVDGEGSQFNKSATLSYGITLRRLNNELFPTRGYLFNTQFQVAPFEQLSDGRFIQSQAKFQVYYPIAKKTQFIGRIEAGMVNGSTSVPATYLFRAGGDQSVRGYGFQSLGIDSGDAVLGGRVMLTGSTEVIQWLTKSWGAAAFVDFGNAANSWDEYEAVYGYGLGVRWRSPVGPVGLDVAYGEKTGDYRLHFNLGVSF